MFVSLRRVVGFCSVSQLRERVSAGGGSDGMICVFCMFCEYMEFVGGFLFVVVDTSEV